MSFSPYPLKEIGEFLAHKPETSLHAHLHLLRKPPASPPGVKYVALR